MTDHLHPPRRLDLRALDTEPDAARDEIVMRAVLQRIATTPQRDVELARLLRFRRAMMAVAAALAALAVGVARELPRRPADTGVAAVAAWIDAGHIPSNGELLASMQESRR